MTADEFTAPAETGTVVIDTAQVSTEQANDEAMEAAWNAMQDGEPNGEQPRSEDGKFKGKEGAETETAELEGAAEGGEEKEGNSAVTETDIPLPSQLYGLDDVWGKIPVEDRPLIAGRMTELNARMSDMGRQVSQAKPLLEVADKFSTYFNSNLKHPDGSNVTPASAVEYLFGIQSAMDKDPSSTLLGIIETYGVREQIAQALGTQAAPQQNDNRQLLAKIDRLESIIQQANDPSRVEKVIDQREAQAETSRLLKSDPLISEIPENRLVFFIQEGWDKLGETASRESVLKYAVKAATEADPALRAKTQAAVKAATGDKQKAEAAKRATGVNVTSTSSGKARIMTDTEAMEAEWAKMGMPN